MTTYTVKSGDWLSKIAVAFYGTYQPIGTWDPIKAIAAANPQISNINAISPGQVINIPDKPGSSSVSTSTPTVTSTAPGSGGQAASTVTNAVSSIDWKKVGIYGGAILLAAGIALAVKKGLHKKVHAAIKKKLGK